MAHATMLSPEHHIFRETLRVFIQKEILPNVDRWEEQQQIDRIHDGLYQSEGSFRKEIAGLPGYPSPYSTNGCRHQNNQGIRKPLLRLAEQRTICR